MAVANISFKMPQEPCPLPSLESDEESFVVLGQSIPDCSNDDYSSPIDLSVVTEAKRLISSELAALEEMKKKDEQKESLVLEASKDVAPKELLKMDSSATLPAMPFIERGNESSNTISIASFSADMSSEEVQGKISQIIEENIQLKDTVLQNNMSMKSQYERIVAWQEEVQKIHQAHKEKLLEAKTFIENLRKEKESMKQDLIKVGEAKQHLEKEIDELKKSLKEKEKVTTGVLVQRSDDNIKEFQLDVANKKIRDLEIEVEKLTAENKKLAQEAVRIKEEEITMRHLEAQLEKLAVDNTKLKEEENKLRNQEHQKIEQIRKMEPEIQRLIEKLNLSNKKVEELEQALIQKTQKEEALIMTINSLRAQIETPSPSEESTKLRTQLAEIQTNLMHVEFSRGQAYAQVSQLSHELSSVKYALEEIKKEREQEETRPRQVDGSNDEVYALRAQLDVYKTDFEEERHAREVIKSEKDRLEDDLQNLQRRNQQLQEEIEILRENRDFVVYPNQSTARGAVSKETRTRSVPDSFKCPKCNFGFSNIEQLQTHVYRCIEIDDHLP